MKKYIRIITVSYATRKVLLIKENDNWCMLEDKHEIGTVEALVKKLYFQKKAIIMIAFLIVLQPFGFVPYTLYKLLHPYLE